MWQLYVKIELYGLFSALFFIGLKTHKATSDQRFLRFQMPRLTRGKPDFMRAGRDSTESACFAMVTWHLYVKIGFHKANSHSHSAFLT
jgi:hypothetical protein